MHILSIYYDVLGHAPAEENLKNGFLEKFPDSAYTAIKLSTIRNELRWQRKLVGLLGFPIMGKSKIDFFFNRFRAELSLSILTLIYFKKLDKKEMDVLHFRTQCLTLVMAKLFKKYNVVVTIDMTADQGMALRPKSKFSYGPIGWLEKKVFNSGAVIVSYSNIVKQNLIEKFKVNPNNARHVYPYVNNKFFEISLDRVSPIPNILFVGNDFIRKGGDLLLGVFEKNFLGGAQLHIVSNDPILDMVSLPKGAFVYRNKKANSNELLALFSMADFFVLPTREEAYGLVFSEAMAAGLPCIGTNHMAIPELIADGKDGFLMEIDDEAALTKNIQTLITDKELRQIMAQNARNKALERYMKDDFLNAYHQIFSSVSNKTH